VKVAWNLPNDPPTGHAHRTDHHDHVGRDDDWSVARAVGEHRRAERAHPRRAAFGRDAERTHRQHRGVDFAARRPHVLPAGRRGGQPVRPRLAHWHELSDEEERCGMKPEHSSRLIVGAAFIVALLFFIAGLRVGTFDQAEQIRQLQTDLDAHKVILIHPGAALSSVVVDIDKRLRAVENLHRDEAVESRRLAAEKK